MAQVYGRVGSYGPALLAAILAGGVALDNGGYDATTWGWSTLLPLVVAGGALGVGAARRPGTLALSFLALLVGLAAWTALSVAWSIDVSQSVLELERLLVYVACTAAILVLDRRHVGSLLAGLVVGIAVACGWALWLRAFGGAGSYDVASVSPGAARRLAEPLGYSNGLGAFAAIGAVVATTAALRLRQAVLASPVLLFLPTLYFTYSRGAWLALVVGALAAFALSVPRIPRRVAFAAAAVCVVGLVVALVGLGDPRARCGSSRTPARR